MPKVTHVLEVKDLCAIFLIEIMLRSASQLMSSLILGIGPGLFAIVFTAGFALLIALIGAYFYPSAAVYILLVALTLPILMFAIILSAPFHVNVSRVSLVDQLYDDGPNMNSNPIIDNQLPHRISVLVVVSLGALLGILFQVGVLVLQAPSFSFPKVQSRRKRLEALRPSWCR